MEWSLSLSVVLVLLHCSPGHMIKTSPSSNNSDPIPHSNPLFSSHHSVTTPQLTPTIQPVSHVDLIDGGIEVPVNSNQSPKHTMTEEATLKVLQESSMIDQIEQFHSTPIQANPRSPDSQTTVIEEISDNEPLDKNLFQTGKEHTQPICNLQTTESSASSSPTVEHTAIQHEVMGKDKHWPVPPVHYGVFNSITHQGLSRPGGPCVLGLGLCVVPTGPNGTSLLWEDLSRTLAFAWELHVFGSASLFLLLAGGAVLGMVGTSTLLHPLCDSLTLANGLLLLTGVLRALHLLIDPYGTRRILSRPVLTALHNMPLTLLLWAQVALALTALRRINMNLLPLALQRPSVVGGLAALHCTLLLVADLLSSTMSPALPVLLQTLSLCWSLPLCLGILIQSLSHLHPFLRTRTPIPQWGEPQRIEERVRQVTAVCALLGVLCCGLQIYSLLWLYGLLGDWRQFGWCWWLGQFWARVLELAWGFSLLALGFWVFWRPQRSHTRSEPGHWRLEGLKRVERASFWETVLKRLRGGPFRKSEKNWAELMPNNWAGQQHSRADINSSIISNFDSPPITHSLGDGIFDHKVGPFSSSSGDSQAVVLWQQVGERECILSLIEFDMRPLSPINLRRSIDNAFHYGHLLGVGSLFSPPPPSTTHNMDTDISLGGSVTTLTSPTHVGCRGALDAGSSPASPDHFQTKEDTVNQIPSPFLNREHQGEGPSRAIEPGISGISQEDDRSSITSGDDITDL